LQKSDEVTLYVKVNVGGLKKIAIVGQ